MTPSLHFRGRWISSINFVALFFIFSGLWSKRALRVWFFFVSLALLNMHLWLDIFFSSFLVLQSLSMISCSSIFDTFFIVSFTTQASIFYGWAWSGTCGHWRFEVFTFFFWLATWQAGIGRNLFVILVLLPWICFFTLHLHIFCLSLFIVAYIF